MSHFEVPLIYLPTFITYHVIPLSLTDLLPIIPNMLSCMIPLVSNTYTHAYQRRHFFRKFLTSHIFVSCVIIFCSISSSSSIRRHEWKGLLHVPEGFLVKSRNLFFHVPSYSKIPLLSFDYAVYIKYITALKRKGFF